MRRDFIELPAGKLEPGEPHLDTAKRELLEETGYAAARVDAPRRHPHRDRLYRRGHRDVPGARSSRSASASWTQGEFLEIFDRRRSTKRSAMIRDGRITDAKTVAALLWVEAFVMEAKGGGKGGGPGASR